MIWLVTSAQTRYADDLVVGETITLGRFRVEEAEMLEFARRWDPQSFHVDAVAAAGTIFGRVIASGAYSLAVFQRLAVLGAFQHWAVIAGRRIRDLEFLSPVTPGQDLLATVTVVENRPVQPTRSLVVLAGRLVAEQTTVLTLQMEIYVSRSA